MKTRLEEHYLTAVRPALIEKFGYANAMQAPKLEKIVINMGVGEAVRDSKKVEHAARELAAITGQSRLSLVQRRPMRLLNYARGCQSAVRSHCAASICTSFSTGW